MGRRGARRARGSGARAARRTRPASRPGPRAPTPGPAGAAPLAAAGSVTAHAGGPALSNQYAHDDVLVVVSKVKKYIRDRSGMNTSDAVAEALGAHVRKVCDDAIRNAARDGRKTVLDATCRRRSRADVRRLSAARAGSCGPRARAHAPPPRRR